MDNKIKWEVDQVVLKDWARLNHGICDRVIKEWDGKEELTGQIFYCLVQSRWNMVVLSN